MMYLIGAIARLFFIKDTALSLFYLGYIESVINILLGIYVLYLCKRFQYTVFADLKHPYININYILPFCILFGFLFHPGKDDILNLSLSTQAFVNMSIFSEAFALLP